jgi:hypothetical protein
MRFQRVFVAIGGSHFGAGALDVASCLTRLLSGRTAEERRRHGSSPAIVQGIDSRTKPPIGRIDSAEVGRLIRPDDAVE